MSQHDLILDDQSGANFLADLNLAIKAIASNALGNSRPATAYAGQFWVDADYDTNADALMYIVDPANASKDTVVAVIETSSGKWLAPGNKETVDVDCSAGGTITLSALEDAYGVVNLTGTPAAAFNLVVSNRKLGRAINNNSGKAATVKTSGGTGVIVADGAVNTPARCDGTNVVLSKGGYIEETQSLSGTNVDFSIDPSMLESGEVSKVTIQLKPAQGAFSYLQLGTAGGFDASADYKHVNAVFNASAGTWGNLGSATGTYFHLSNGSNPNYGTITMTHMGSNVWSVEGEYSYQGAYMYVLSGHKTLSAALNSLRFSASSWTSGSITVRWE